MGLERECNTTAFCFLLPCFGLFFYLPFFPFSFPFPFVLVLVLSFGFGFGFGFPLRLCAFAPLRSLLQPFPFEPLRSRSRSRFNFYG
jgi:hypothetical protein